MVYYLIPFLLFLSWILWTFTIPHNSAFIPYTIIKMNEIKQLEWLKTHWQMLQQIIEEQDYFYSLHEFLLESSEEDRKEIEKRLTDMDYKQFYDYMDWFTFVNRTEVECACCEYTEFVMQRPLGMWEMWDMSEVADDYISTRGLKFDDEEE